MHAASFNGCAAVVEPTTRPGKAPAQTLRRSATTESAPKGWGTTPYRDRCTVSNSINSMKPNLTPPCFPAVVIGDFEQVIMVELHSGSSVNLIKESTVEELCLDIVVGDFDRYIDADESFVLPPDIVGLTCFPLRHGGYDLQYDGFVVADHVLSNHADILVGAPFMELNDVSVRPSKQRIMFGDDFMFSYGACDQSVRDTGSTVSTNINTVCDSIHRANDYDECCDFDYLDSCQTEPEVWNDYDDEFCDSEDVEFCHTEIGDANFYHDSDECRNKQGDAYNNVEFEFCRQIQRKNDDEWSEYYDAACNGINGRNSDVTRDKDFDRIVDLPESVQSGSAPGDDIYDDGCTPLAEQACGSSYSSDPVSDAEFSSAVSGHTDTYVSAQLAEMCGSGSSGAEQCSECFVCIDGTPPYRDVGCDDSVDCGSLTEFACPGLASSTKYPSSSGCIPQDVRCHENHPTSISPRPHQALGLSTRQTTVPSAHALSKQTMENALPPISEAFCNAKSLKLEPPSDVHRKIWCANWDKLDVSTTGAGLTASHSGPPFTATPFDTMSTSHRCLYDGLQDAQQSTDDSLPDTCPQGLLAASPSGADSLLSETASVMTTCSEDSHCPDTPSADHDKSGHIPLLEGTGNACYDSSPPWNPPPWTISPRPPSSVDEGGPLPLTHAGAVNTLRVLVTAKPTCVSSTPVGLAGLTPVDSTLPVLWPPCPPAPQQYPPSPPMPP